VVVRFFFFSCVGCPCCCCCCYSWEYLCGLFLWLFLFLFLIIIFFLIHRKTNDLEEPIRRLFDFASSIFPYKD
jgi:hypothetical protein